MQKTNILITRPSKFQRDIFGKFDKNADYPHHFFYFEKYYGSEENLDPHLT